MAHEIYNGKFMSLRQPAWHGLGTVITDEIGAVEAGRRIGVPEIHTEHVLTTSGLPTGHKAIVGAVNQVPTVFAVVSNRYHEITHQSFCESWDKGVSAHVETIGVLRDGAGMFISAKLPTFDVKGDEVEAYVLAENWLTGTRATKIKKTPVRVVCMNTLVMSDAEAVEEIRIHHNRTAVQQLEQSLVGLIERSTAEYCKLQTVYEILASKKVNERTARSLLSTVYPDRQASPALLARASSDPLALDLLCAWERSNKQQAEHREAAYALFAGDGVGADTKAAKGTAWGAYNAVVEYEQYLKKHRQIESLMFGEGRNRTAQAYDELCYLALQ